MGMKPRVYLTWNVTRHKAVHGEYDFYIERNREGDWTWSVHKENICVRSGVEAGDFAAKNAARKALNELSGS